jgi:hypothetical protein
MTVDWIEKDVGDLHIPEFAHGFLLAISYQIFDDVLETGELDDWQQVDDVPLYAGKNCPYKNYDLNFWYGEYDDKWYCTAYEVQYNEDGSAWTNTDEYKRLW